MELKEIEERIKKVVVAQFGKEVEFDKIESIRFVELIVRIEDEFDIEIEDDDLNVNVLGNYELMAKYIQSKLE